MRPHQAARLSDAAGGPAAHRALIDLSLIARQALFGGVERVGETGLGAAGLERLLLGCHAATRR